MKRPLLLLLFFASLSSLYAQSGGIIRGNVYDQESGEPIIYGTIRLEGANIGTNTDLDGFFSLSNVEPGDYTLVASYVGYDSTTIKISVKDGGITYERIVLSSSSVDLSTVNVSARREQARSDVQVSKLAVSPQEIRSLPATGGEPDIAQYLPVLPGIISSGDQGGQLYIRGGSPVQNMIMLDGMILYNPFHSIGFFSVFETETLRNVDVYTGGFNSEYGGRISAVVDIQTREGNKKRLSGLASASPFQAKVLLEGPLKKFNEETGGSTSFLLTAKQSLIAETSPSLYGYATDTAFFSFAARDTTLSDLDDIGLPYTWRDLYGKLSFVSGNGSKLNLFGFAFNDEFDFVGLATSEWTTYGGGADFTLVPPTSNIVIDGTVSFSDYEIELVEQGAGPRRSGITNYTAQLNFTYFGLNNQIDYGFAFTGFNTDFEFLNPVGLSFQQEDFTTELAGYFKYKHNFNDRLIIEPGLRLQFYASQSAFQLEPRLGIKYNATPRLRFKAAGGLYSQNLISTLNDLDIVNFFIGFLAGPEETLFEPGTTTPTDDRLQKSAHAIAGVEYDVSDRLTINVEPYYKRFRQLININRNKLSASDPDFITETGDAYGIDFSARYQARDFYLWSTYSLARVTRDDGFQEYPTIFDRRHNINLLASYTFGTNNEWEAGLRWNYGSGFPFTQTQGFYQNVNLEQDLLQTDVLTGNFPIGTLLDEDLNGGRLSDYHRLDASLKRTFTLGKYTSLELLASVTNLYDRANVFYVDRLTNTRVDQLPILPSLAATFKF